MASSGLVMAKSHWPIAELFTLASDWPSRVELQGPLDWKQCAFSCRRLRLRGISTLSRVVEALRPAIRGEFFGCAGPRMQGAGVRAVVDARSLAVVGIVEVAAHIPRIYREFRSWCARPARNAGCRAADGLARFPSAPGEEIARDGIPVVHLIARRRGRGGRDG